jgi:hypothetical protein
MSIPLCYSVSMRRIAILGTTLGTVALLSACVQTPDIRIGGEMSSELTEQIRASSEITTCEDTGLDFRTSFELTNSSDRSINVSLITIQFYRWNDLVGESVFGGPDPLPVGRTYRDSDVEDWWDGSEPLTCEWGTFTILGK